MELPGLRYMRMLVLAPIVASDTFIVPCNVVGWFAVIASNWSGQTQFMNAENSYLLPVVRHPLLVILRRRPQQLSVFRNVNTTVTAASRSVCFHFSVLGTTRGGPCTESAGASLGCSLGR